MRVFNTGCDTGDADVVLPCQVLTEGDKNATTPPPSRAGLDLATTLERIQQSFVVSDPNLPDCPIVFASDGFIEYTGCGHPLAPLALFWLPRPSCPR
jgi:hypothetical protein